MVAVMINIFLNEIFSFVHKFTLYNNADDNTVFYADNDPITVLENDNKTRIK